MAGCIRQIEKKEKIVVSAGKSLRIEQQRRTTRESVKDRKEGEPGM